MPDQLLIGRIRQDEAMFRAVKQCRETRRLEEHLLQSTNLHVGVDRKFLARVGHLSNLPRSLLLVNLDHMQEFEPV
jgi:hypothetical protein